MNILSNATFVFGALSGYEQRKTGRDEYALWKLTGLTASIVALRGWSETVKDTPKPRPGTVMLGGFIAGILISGLSYYVGGIVGKRGGQVMDMK